MSKFSLTSNEELCFLSENMGVSLTLQQAEQLNQFNNLLIKWTKRFNLVATSTLDDSITRHVLDALSVGPFINQQPLVVNENVPQSALPIYDVLDVGSGAGLPVLPLAIAFPALSFVSVETNGKKVRFQRQVKLELGLENIEVLHHRIEEVHLQARNVTSRAFAAPESFLTLCEQHCVDGGQAIVMLGQAELLPKPLPTPWQLHDMQRIDVPGEMAERHVAVCIRGTLTA